MTLSLILLTTSALCYFVALVFNALSFSGTWEKGDRFAFTLTRVGFLVGTFYFAAEALEHGSFLPVANLSQALAFFAWSIAFVYLVLLVKVQNESFGLVLTPLLLLLTGFAVWAKISFGASEALPPKEVLLNPYFTMHIATAFFAYASFTLSFAAGLLYLIQHRELKAKRAGQFYHRLPSLEELEKLIAQPLLWGAPLLLIAMAIGVIWSKSAFGEYWIFDAKTIVSAITACFYFAILFLRQSSFLRGKQVAVLSMCAFALVMVSFFGTRLIESSHNYLQ